MLCRFWYYYLVDFRWLIGLVFLEHLMNSRKDLGMNDLDSPLWASDHFAVVTDLMIHATTVIITATTTTTSLS